MKIKADELVKILAVLRPALAKKDMVEQMAHFIFTGDNVVTYNDQICISYPFKSNFKCSIGAEELYKILCSIGDSEIIIELVKNQLSIVGPTIKANLSVLISEEDRKAEKAITELGLNKLEKWKKLSDDFVKAVFLCMFSASDDMSYGVLTCIHISGNLVESSDNLRISRYKMKDTINNQFLISKLSAAELVKLVATYYHLAPAWVHFKTKDGVIFSARKVAGDYPSIDKFFGVEGEKIQLPTSLKKAAEDVSILADGEFEIDKRIEVIINKRSIICRGEKSCGWVESSVECNQKNESRFFINPIFLSQVLEKTTMMIVAKNTAYFMSGSFEHIMSLPTI